MKYGKIEVKHPKSGRIMVIDMDATPTAKTKWIVHPVTHELFRINKTKRTYPQDVKQPEELDCTTCDKDLPRSAFYVKNEKPKYPGGPFRYTYSSTCKKCSQMYSQERRDYLKLHPHIAYY